MEAVANAGPCLGATCRVLEECASHCLVDRLLADLCLVVSTASCWPKSDMIPDPIAAAAAAQAVPQPKTADGRAERRYTTLVFSGSSAAAVAATV